jgi:hypothetical protein
LQKLKGKFDEDPVRLSDVVGVIGRSLGDPSGWQLMRRKS